MKKIIINGRFLTQRITGAQRFAHEIIRELDKIVEKGKFKIIAPKNIIYNLELKNIEIELKGRLQGQLWEQLELPRFIKKNEKLLNFCNSAPFIKTGVVTIHDVSTSANPNFFSWKFRNWYKLMNNIITKTSDKIITVSEFSKSEIIKYFKVPKEKIEVIYNGWQHMNRIKEDKTILEKENIKPKNYYFAVSSISPNKNFKFILNVAKDNPTENFIIAGKFNSKLYSEVDFNIESLKNVKYVGYICDEELKALYQHAKAFIFPSFYEGFGIPPLEALACGTEAIVSNTSCLPEIFGENVKYINPKQKNINISTFLFSKAGNKSVILEKYNWKISSKNVLSNVVHRLK